MPRVLNVRTASMDELKTAVYVGRASGVAPNGWGNPYRLLEEAERQRVISLFETLVKNNPAFQQQIRAVLAGRDLMCHCAPKACHADVLLRYANNDPDDEL